MLANGTIPMMTAAAPAGGDLLDRRNLTASPKPAAPAPHEPGANSAPPASTKEVQPEQAERASSPAAPVPSTVSAAGMVECSAKRQITGVGGGSCGGSGNLSGKDVGANNNAGTKISATPKAREAAAVAGCPTTENAPSLSRHATANDNNASPRPQPLPPPSYAPASLPSPPAVAAVLAVAVADKTSSSSAATVEQDADNDSPTQTSQAHAVATQREAADVGDVQKAAAPNSLATNGVVANGKRLTSPPTGENGYSVAAAVAAVAAAAGADCSNNIRCFSGEVAANDNKRADIPAAGAAAPTREDRSETEFRGSDPNTNVMDVDDAAGGGRAGDDTSLSATPVVAEGSSSRTRSTMEDPPMIVPLPPTVWCASSMMTSSQRRNHLNGDDGVVRELQDAMQADEGSKALDEERKEGGVMEEQEDGAESQQVWLKFCW